MGKKRIVFLTGTRADFGKLKSLMKITQESDIYDVHIFTTGMHMNSKYGRTVDEVIKSGFKNVYTYINHDEIDHMDRTLAKTVDGFSHYIAEIKPDMIVVHGDRVEALAGAIVGSLNNILVVHIEGGELSGTIDELIRHSVSKLSHIHLVSNEEAKKRLIQLGELDESIFIIGSPDFDIMQSEQLPSLEYVKEYYGIDYDDYAILLYHPVTTEYEQVIENVNNVVNSTIDSDMNYIVVYPNNDLGSIEILNAYKKFKCNDHYKLFPSIRFEYFIVLLKNAEFIIGNSSAGIREAPFFNIPTIDIGTRQKNRAKFNTVFNCVDKQEKIEDMITKVKKMDKFENDAHSHFGTGESDKLFFSLLGGDDIWNISTQKQFRELKFHE